MPKTAHVFSTLANDQTYVNYTRAPGGEMVPSREIFIKGGAGVANKRLITPLGVATEIDEALLPELESNKLFQLHKQGNFVSIRTRSADPDKVATDMNRRDLSAPLTEADYQDENGPKVIAPAMH